MPSRHRDTYAEYYDEEDYRPSRSSSRFDKLVHAVNDGQFHDAKDIVKSAVAGHGIKREVEPYDYHGDYHSRPTRRYQDEHAYGYKHRESDYYRYHDRYPRRGRSLHGEERRGGGRRDRSRHAERSHSENRVKEAATAALAAGVAEAVRSRHSRDQSKRAITAAVGAAAVDAFVSNGEDKKKGRHIAESAVSGLLIDRLANGRSSH
ncbi:hypothetical protein NOR_07760 [Metarhizium rileyi]|uniref:Uncharacterized protein n=1 Tax=Metarhizium rileyi (strain RCEF 4871) TaxID=1649241 RepID=A0A166XLS5_METRR|nr:hypothetical protein NOR_07760 [Metarhizium rileyi RCEF 4871]TWU71116.1 hypothetical protein ED733_001660 [Metarhizium rileyi]